MDTASWVIAGFTVMIGVATVVYCWVTWKLWKVTSDNVNLTRDSLDLTRNGLVADLLMRMIEYQPPTRPTGPERQAWSKWAGAFNVAVGASLSEELAYKLAETVVRMKEVTTGEMDEKTRRIDEKVGQILKGKHPGGKEAQT